MLAVYLIKTEGMVVDDTRGLLGCKFILASAGTGVISGLALGFCSKGEHGSSCIKTMFKVAAKWRWENNFEAADIYCAVHSQRAIAKILQLVLCKAGRTETCTTFAKNDFKSLYIVTP